MTRILCTLLCAGASLSWPGYAGAAATAQDAGKMPALRLPAPSQVSAVRPAAVQATRYEIDVTFEPEKSFLRAKATVTVRADKPVDRVEFELNSKLKISSVTDAHGRKLEFIRSGVIGSPRVQVRLAEPASGEFAITFTYEGVLPPKPLDYITKDGILLRDESRWYPAVDLSAFTQNRISLRLPADWRAVASGSLEKHAEENGRLTLEWETTRPVSSRAIAAGPPNRLKCNAPPGSPIHWPANMTTFVFGCFAQEFWPPGCCRTNLMEAVDRIYDSTVWPFSNRGLRREPRLEDLAKGAQSLPEPLERKQFTVVQGFPGQRGSLGYSAPGFLVVSEDVVKYHGYPGYAPEFLPHEIAHQWFPIEVTLASAEDGWLAESLAEYLAWRYLQERDPEQARLLVARAMRDTLAHEPLRPLARGLRLFAQEDWEVTHATLYERGMLVWRMLETVIGRQRVDAALREYYKRFAGRSASVSDFRKICEEISARDLGWFFDYFLNGTRLPEITLRRLPAPAPGEAAGEIVVRNVPPEFQVRVEMRLHTAKGVVDHSVATRGEVTPFTVTVPDAVTQITLDPDARLLRQTEAALRHKQQLPPLAQLGELERAGKFAEALRLCEQALAADPENLAVNHQQIYFAMGRLRYRQKQFTRAGKDFERALTLRSLDTMGTDFLSVWSRIYRARIASARGNVAGARAEIKAGLAMKSPALDTRIRWPESARETSAAAELRLLSK